MANLAENPMLIVVAVIGLVIAIGVIVEALPDSISDWYAMVEAWEDINQSVAGDQASNVSSLFILVMRYAPLGIALAFFGLFFTIVLVAGKKKGIF